MPYLNMEQTAVGSLDAVRAAVSLVTEVEDTGVRPSTSEVVLWGGSQGGHAEGAVWSLPEQTDWVAARLTGAPIEPARLCQRQAAVRCSGQPAN